MNKIIAVCMLSLFILNTSAQSGDQNLSLIPGKMYFSDKPFTTGAAGSKTNFTSNEFIYGRIELSGSTIREAFKLKEGAGLYYLVCEVAVFKDGEPVGYHVSHGNYFLLSKESLDKTWLNLDVLPEPSTSSTLYSMTSDFTAGYGYMPMYNMINPDYFPSGGNYRVNVRVHARTYNAYDQQENREKWPFITDGFDFTLREADIATLKKNGKASRDVMNNNAFRFEKLPNEFSNPAKITDPKATNAKIAAILKRDLPDRAILKFVVEKYDGGLWSIAKNDLGIPKYRYFNPHVWVAYKMGGRCLVGHVTLREDYSGGGTYGPLHVGFTTASNTGGDRSIDCAKVK